MNKLTEKALRRFYEIYARIEKPDAGDDEEIDEVSVNLIKDGYFVHEKEENNLCYTLEDFLTCDKALINCCDTFHYATTEFLEIESLEHIEMLEKSFNDLPKEDRWLFNTLWQSRVANVRVLDGWYNYFKNEKTKRLFDEMPERPNCCGGSCQIKP